MKNGRTLIVGSYGYGNMGDEAILQGILEDNIDRKAVDVVSATPGETESLHKVKAVSKYHIDYSQYASVMLGGGGYHPGAYKIPMTICLTLKQKGAKLFVKALGLTPEVAGKEVFGSNGPGTQGKALLTELVKKADSFSVRTHKDLERVRKYTGLNKGITVETCPAFNISFSKERGKEILTDFGFSIKEPLCGVSLCKFGYRKGLKDLLKNYVKDFTLVPIIMCRHYYAAFENDILLLRTYLKKLNLLSKTVMDFIEYPFSPSELKSILSCMSYLITSRKHAMVLSLGASVQPEQLLFLGTKESGMAEYFNVEEADWRQWSRSADRSQWSPIQWKFEFKCRARILKRYLSHRFRKERI